MNFKYINYKRIISLILSGFTLITITGCHKNNNQIEYIKPTINNIEEMTEILESKSETIKLEKETTNQEYSKKDIEDKTNQEYSKEDLEAIKEFNKIYNNLNNKKENFKDNCKEIFITTIDFIFYDKEINGIKFNDLTDNGKQKILEISSNIDNKIETHYPNYKDTITNSSKKAFNKASELIKKGITNLDEISKEKLGLENYNEIINAKNEFLNNLNKAIDVGKEIYDDSKQYIKKWYDNFKNK